MKLLFTLLSTTALLTTSFSTMASEEVMADIMAKFDNGSEKVSLAASKELSIAFANGSITSSDLKNYLSDNIGPRANKTIALIEKAESGAIDRTTLESQFKSAVLEMDDGAAFLPKTHCPHVGLASMIIAAGTGIASLAYGTMALLDSSSIRDKEIENKQAKLRIEQIKNDSSIPSDETVIVQAQGSTTTSFTGSDGVTVTNHESLLLTYRPPTKSELIAQQEKAIEKNQQDITKLKKDHEQSLVGASISGVVALVSGEVAYSCVK